MKILTIVFGAFTAVWSQSCHSDVSRDCAGGTGVAVDISSCTVSGCGGNDALMERLEAHVAYQIRASHSLLQMVIPFGASGLGIGFQRLFRNLSDSSWENAIDAMKEMTKHGGSWSTRALSRVNISEGSQYPSSEIHNLASALDMQKEFINQLYRVHYEAQTRAFGRVNSVRYGIPTYLDTSMLPRITSNIRTLAGFITELRRMLNMERGTGEFSIYFFDEYLKSIY